MAGLYSRRAGQKLKALLEGAAAADRASLEEEVDLSRVLCDRAVRTFEKLCIDEVPDTLKDKPGKLASMRAKATSQLRQALSHVSSMVLSHRKVVSETALDAHAAEYVVAQVVKILEERLDDQDLMETIVHDLEALKVPAPTVTVTVG